MCRRVKIHTTCAETKRQLFLVNQGKLIEICQLEILRINPDHDVELISSVVRITAKYDVVCCTILPLQHSYYVPTRDG